MISKQRKVTKYTCIKCGKTIKALEGEIEVHSCPKCGGKEFEKSQETEVITK